MNITALLAGLFSGMAGAMGLGGGAVLIIYLNLFTDTEPLTARGINLIFFIPISLLAVIIYAIRGEIKWKTVIPLALFGFLGAVGGILLTNFISAEIIGEIFGGLLIIMGIRETFFGVAKGRK